MTPEIKQALFEFANKITDIDPIEKVLREVAKSSNARAQQLELTPKGFLGVHFDRLGKKHDQLLEEAVAFCRNYHRREMALEILTAMGFVETTKEAADAPKEA